MEESNVYLITLTRVKERDEGWEFDEGLFHIECSVEEVKAWYKRWMTNYLHYMYIFLFWLVYEDICIFIQQGSLYDSFKTVRLLGIVSKVFSLDSQFDFVKIIQGVFTSDKLSFWLLLGSKYAFFQFVFSHFLILIFLTPIVKFKFRHFCWFAHLFGKIISFKY